MKVLLNIVLLYTVLTSNLLADTSSSCKVFIANSEFNHAGVSITFLFDKLFEKKNYLKVDQKENADFILDIKGEELFKKYFYHAYATISVFKYENGKVIGKYASTFHKRCYQQYCSISDFKASFSNAYSQFLKSGPNCKELLP